MNSPTVVAPEQAGTAVRAAAAQVVDTVISQGRSLNDSLAQQESNFSGRNRAFLRELGYGTLRWYYPLHYVLRKLLQKPLKARDSDIEALLLTGLYQLLYLRTPAYATVAASTEAARLLGKSWATGLLNGVLRNAQRRQDELLQAIEQNPESASAHPKWLLRLLQEAWPADWPALVAANNQRPPQSLRVNARLQTRTGYLAALEQVGIEAQPAPYTEYGINLTEPQDVPQLPGFKQGWFAVQDPAAQLAGGLLQASAGQRVLDACAAPGGKTCQLLETVPELELWALDKDAGRLQQVRVNLQRLGLQAQLLTADAAQPDDWWDGQAFDRILLDAPCSGSGVIRRHPDIKLLRQARDIETLAAQQIALLRGLWPLLRPGGQLLYVTCSVLPTETTQVVTQFCSEQRDACIEPIAAEWGQMAEAGRYILPGSSGMDGFFYARLRKSS